MCLVYSIMKPFIIIVLLAMSVGCSIPFVSRTKEQSWKEISNEALGVFNPINKDMNYATVLPLAKNHLLVPSDVLTEKDQGLILYHCQDNYYRENLYLKSEIKYSIVAKDLHRGLTLIKVHNFEINNPYNFNHSDFPDIGEEIYYVGGFPNGPVILKSLVSKYFVDKETLVLQSSFPVMSQYGYAGGYVFNKDKEVIAILLKEDSVNSQINHCVRLDNIKYFLLDHNLLNLFKKD